MTDRDINWIDIWFDDKRSMVDTMRRNMVADLEAGYDLNGHIIRKQVVDLEEYEMQFNREAEVLRVMEPAKAKHWCYIDLKRRGATA